MRLLGDPTGTVLDECFKAAGSPASEGSADHRSQATHLTMVGPGGLSRRRMEHATTSVLRESRATHSGRRPYQIYNGYYSIHSLGNNSGLFDSDQLQLLVQRNVLDSGFSLISRKKQAAASKRNLLPAITVD